MSEFSIDKEKINSGSMNTELGPSSPSIIPKTNIHLGRSAVRESNQINIGSENKSSLFVNQLSEPNYEESIIDWGRLNTLAKHVAENTKKVTGRNYSTGKNQ